jgi:AraC family transcriptional regulator of arabinose operon
MAVTQRATTQGARSAAVADVLVVRQVTASGTPAAISHGIGTQHWTVIYTTSGRSGFELRGTRLELDADSLVAFRRDEGRTVKRYGTMWEAFIACFAPGADWTLPSSFERRGDDIFRAHITHTATRQRIREAFGRMIADARTRNARRALRSLSRDGAGARSAGEARRQILSLTLTEIFLLAGDDVQQLASVDGRVRAALERMAADLAAPHTVRSLGRAAHLSASHFGHLFSAELGISPLNALRLMRLEEAALQLRHTQDTVERIAEATGFASTSHLSREFRRHFGVSPRTYRAGA